MALALNVLALVMVLGMCWMAMMWLSGRSHGFGAERHGLTADAVAERPETDACSVCEGVGAKHASGKLEPCGVCRGTGVAS